MDCFAYYDTALGTLEVGVAGAVVVRLRWVDEPSAHPHRPTALSDEAARQVRQYLAGERQTFALPLAPSGTEFQRSVWRILADIPYGKTATYGQIARILGRPGAARAVGAAAARNPLWLAVPCHRCVGRGGRLTGYAGGLWRKTWLLELEKGEEKSFMADGDVL